MLEHDPLTFIGRTTFRRARRLFGIQQADRRQHLYVIGQTGTGKSTLLEALMRQDLVNGAGFALIDPHGDLAERVVARCPPGRRSGLTYWNVPDPSITVTFNPLAASLPATRILAASGVLEVFKKLWLDSWGPRLEHLLRYALLALVEIPGATLADLLRLLEDDGFRRDAAQKVGNPQVRRFWLEDYGYYFPARRRAEALAPVQNKVGSFLAHPRLRQILCEGSESTDLRRLMDTGGVLVVNLSKGRLGEDATALFGALLVSTLARLGLERADQPEDARPDFAVYCDELQIFTTLSVANMLAELRKYGVHLIVAHQYLAQLEPDVLHAILGNVGTLIAFRVGPSDVKVLAAMLDADIEPADLMRLPNHHVYVRLMVDGMPRQAFSAEALRL